MFRRCTLLLVLFYPNQAPFRRRYQKLLCFVILPCYFVSLVAGFLNLLCSKAKIRIVI